jgi:hypothetical protein
MSRLSSSAGIGLHFDSFRESMGLMGLRDRTDHQPDPFFLKTAPRLLEIAEDYGIKLTIFVIGRDLEDPAVADQVRAWQQQGHEIANHSYSHNHNLGDRSQESITREVVEAEILIEKTTGTKPKGFAAPAWSLSRRLIRVLIQRGYSYDASLFPSWIKIPMMLKLKLRSPQKSRFSVWKRSDLSANFLGHSKPHRLGDTSLWRSDPNGIWEIPVPTNGFSAIPCYHTMAFFLGKRLFQSLLRRCSGRQDFLYYVIHPLDILDPDKDLRDVDGIPLSLLERATVPIQKKVDLMRTAFESISSERRVLPLMDAVRLFEGG